MLASLAENVDGDGSQQGEGGSPECQAADEDPIRTVMTGIHDAPLVSKRERNRLSATGASVRAAAGDEIYCTLAYIRVEGKARQHTNS